MPPSAADPTVARDPTEAWRGQHNRRAPLGRPWTNLAREVPLDVRRRARPVRVLRPGVQAGVARPVGALAVVP
eukprot:4821761-Alexandrium_andersonii.AAC.1